MWCFAKINGRLGEIYFDKVRGKNKIRGHCYVKLEEFKTKKERRQIKEDTAHCKFVYRNGRYKMIKI